MWRGGTLSRLSWEQESWACTVFFQKRADATGSLLLNKHAEVQRLTLCDNTDTNPVIFHLMNIAY